jgi:hypothetical protein
MAQAMRMLRLVVCRGIGPSPLHVILARSLKEANR